MSWFTILLMFLVFAMMLGPILLMQPTRRQRALADLRTKAASLGLRVSLHSLTGRNLAVYEAPWQRAGQDKLVGVEWLLKRQSYSHGIHFADWWQWDGTGRPTDEAQIVLRERLTLLPGGILAVEATRLGLRLYWTEAGGESMLVQIADWLKTTVCELKPHIHRQAEPADSDQYQ